METHIRQTKEEEEGESSSSSSSNSNSSSFTYKTDTRKKKPQILQRLSTLPFQPREEYWQPLQEGEGGEEEFPHLVRFRSAHVEFQLPELQSLVHLVKGSVAFPLAAAQRVTALDLQQQVILFESPSLTLPKSPFLPARFSSVEHIKAIASRSVTIM